MGSSKFIIGHVVLFVLSISTALVYFVLQGRKEPAILHQLAKKCQPGNLIASELIRRSYVHVILRLVTDIQCSVLCMWTNGSWYFQKLRNINQYQKAIYWISWDIWDTISDDPGREPTISDNIAVKWSVLSRCLYIMPEDYSRAQRRCDLLLGQDSWVRRIWYNCYSRAFQHCLLQAWLLK